MRYATANIMALPRMPEPHVFTDTTAVATHADVIGWQEIHRDYYIDAVADLPGWHSFGLDLPGGAPISWRAEKFRRIDSGSELLHPATPGVCMERRITWVVLERRSRLRWRRRRVIVTNRHYLPKAWNRIDDPDDDLRRRMWLDAHTTDTTLCEQLLATYPYPMVGVGDYNRHHVKVMGRTLAGHPVTYAVGGGIDYVWFVPSQRRRWRIGEHRTLQLHSDHAGRIVTATTYAR